MGDMKNSRCWLRLAEEAALLSGKFLKNAGKKSRVVQSDLVKDVKISADRQSEKIILKLLKKKSPFAILAEESGLSEGMPESENVWAVDPLDGSINFLRRIPVSCVSIGLLRGGLPFLGVIYDFNKEELFTGIIGKGAWVNGKPISVSSVERKRKAVLCTGIPAKADAGNRAARLWLSEILKYRKARWLGSAALSLAYVSAGRADAYFEQGAMLWDIAAGLAIVRAAGGGYFIKKSRQNSSFSVYAANKKLFNREKSYFLHI